jgi:hypothetical protein
VTEGAVLLHRSAGAPSVRIDDADPDELDPADAQIRRAFAARERLARLKPKQLRDRTLTAAPSLRADIELAPGRPARATVHLDEGTHPVLDATPEAAEDVIALDGGGRVGRETVGLARELLELGALEFAEPE